MTLKLVSHQHQPADLALTEHEMQELDRLERIVQNGMAVFLEVGQALAEIRNARLYRATHSSWEAYLEERWPEIGRRQADRLIGAASVAQDLGPIGLIPTSESQVRPLVGLTSEQRQAAMKAAVEAAGGGQPTARQVEEAARQFRQPPPPPSVRNEPEVVDAEVVAIDEEEIAPPPPTPRPLNLTPIATPQPLNLTPIATPQPLQSTSQLPRAAELIIQRELLTRLLDLTEQTLEQSGESAVVVVAPASLDSSARTLFHSPALRGAVGLLALGARQLSLHLSPGQLDAEISTIERMIEQAEPGQPSNLLYLALDHIQNYLAEVVEDTTIDDQLYETCIMRVSRARETLDALAQ